MATSNRYTVADARFRKASVNYERALEALEKAKSANADNLDQLHAAMAKIFKQLKELDAERIRARARMGEAGSDVFWTNTIRRRTLSEIAVPPPVSFSDILEKERKAIKPTIGQRIEHEYLNIIGKAESGEVEAYIWKEYRPLNDPVLQERLDKLLDRLRTASPYPGEPKSVKIIGDPIDPFQDQMNNCFATADTIYIDVGYLNYNDKTGQIRPSDDELLFIMAHETAHVHRHHFALAIKENIKFDETFDDSFIYKSKLSDAQYRTVREMARNTIQTGFNKAQEFEADRAGAYMAIAAGAKPSGIREGFDWMRRRRGPPPASSTGGAARMHKEKAATHPDPDTRQQAIEKIYSRIFR